MKTIRKTSILLLSTVFLLTLSFSTAGAHQDVYSKFGAVYPKRVKEAPNVQLEDLQGNKVSLDHFKGKPVLLNFWATWCEACKEELPSMQRLHESMADEGIQVVAVSIDRDHEDRIQEYIEKYHLTFPILRDPNQSARRGYFIMGLPTSYLIDSSGKLRGFISGAREWDSALSKQIMRMLLDNDFQASR
jgi:peroxiredoxin